MRSGLLIDYKYCTGCHTCEVACQKSMGWRRISLASSSTRLGQTKSQSANGSTNSSLRPPIVVISVLSARLQANYQHV